MNNITNKDIIYLNHRTSALGKKENNSSAKSDSIINVFKNKTMVSVCNNLNKCRNN
ncbi:hypothetical protein [[Clostridium] scindens]|uniref:hypothetical protein n=1 Tax=Clostridium scindens (strain JCM 10418 / VPI 12708) TaxID=29347 RepID=UPI0039A0D89C